jgi:hypothetical protein
MRNMAPVRPRVHAWAETQLTCARKGTRATWPTRVGRLAASWLPSPNERREMRWQPRPAAPTSITRTRGEVAYRRLKHKN